ncbi:MAG: DNA polymerase III subunit beta [Candidatus Omnitrophica bacterium CG07_land_8_20_14_0_80_50_8]|nr:MAG: DNA polymerase III subunit beta [Candidatus Omnitrophica bacterium CG07_land_8_20_14_0_80_50_8]
MILGLSGKELNAITLILRKFPDVQEAVLFGSRAMGTFKPGSDVDIALKGRIALQAVARIKALLEEESPMPYTFDVVDYHTIETPAFKEHIDKHGQSIYKR